VSTFYVLPARVDLAQQLRVALAGFLPGIDWTSLPDAELTDWLGGLAERQGEVYVVHREDLPAVMETAQTLAEAYGAEPGDVIIEVDAGREVKLTLAPRRAA
jgi:hypothetical protein